MKINWLKEPEEHDYPAAAAYLSLLFDNKTTASIISKLKKTPVTTHKAKDILRASALSPLDMSNYHVKEDAKKIKSGAPISPVLLVRDTAHGKVIIADGYHRLCALYLTDEDIDVFGKIV